MAPRNVPGRLLRRARSDPLAHLRHGTAHRALAHSGSAAAPALRAHRAAARVAQLAPRPRRRQRAAEPGRHHLQRAAPRHDVPGPQFPAVSVGPLGLRAAGRGRFQPARARSAAVRGTTATEVVPAAGDGERGRQDRAAVRRAGGLAGRLQPAVPAAGLPRVDPVTKVVAVSATRRTDGGRERVALNIAYVRALTHAGLVPLLVPPVLDPDAACAALDRVQGLVLTGGEDVEPSRYGAPPHPKLGETDAGRDAVELALIAGAERRRLPILAICRGIQILNVALGGTLYQDLTSERPGPVDHADTRSRHGLRIESGTLLHRTLGAVDAKVNTRHHQAIRDIAPPLRATAWAEDGVIEGAEWKDPGAARVLAVQWHPEDDVEDALFRGFAEAIA